MRLIYLSLVTCLLLPGCAVSGITGRTPIVLNDNAGWCWFQDPRVIVDGDTLLASTVADDSGTDGTHRKGDIDMTVLRLDTLAVDRVVLHKHLEDDDHNAAALMVRPDGRYLAVYGKHNTDRLMRWRISTNPGDALNWEPEQRLDAGARYTYQNVYRLASENGRVYNFHRGVGFNPNYLVSEDDGQTFAYGGRLLSWDTDLTNGLGGGGRPYLRYASNGKDTIHFISTEDHPRNYDNSVYHGFIRDGQLHRSGGKRLAPLSTTREGNASPTDFSLVYKGGPDNVAWTVDLELDTKGLPVALISVQHGDADVARDRSAGGEDLRYVYARFDGERWHTYPLAFAGTRLYSAEADYSGLAAIDPNNTDRVYISTDADPVTGKPLISKADNKRHYEIYRGTTADGGATWSWTPITQDSTADNLRPNVPDWEGGTALLWLRGTYNTFRNYDTQLVGLVLRDD